MVRKANHHLGRWIVLILLIPSLLFSQENEEFEILKPYERSDLGIYPGHMEPAFPKPGEPVLLSLEVQNKQEKPEDGVLVQLYQEGRLLEFYRTSLKPLETKEVSFTIRAPVEEGKSEITAKLESPNLWSDPDRTDNRFNFDMIVDLPGRQSDFRINRISLRKEPENPPLVAVEVENRGKATDNAPLEVMLNRSVRFLKYIPSLAPGTPLELTFPYAPDDPVETVSATINPRFREMELRPGDNTFRRDFRPQKDLAIEDLAIHAPQFSADEERIITVSLNIKNKGRLPVEEDVAVRLTTGLFEAEDAQGTIFLLEGGIPPGEAVSLSHTFRAMPDVFFIKAMADFHQKVAEDDEENNIETVYYRNPTPNIGRWYSIGPSKILNGGLNATGRLYHIAINPNNSNEIYVGAGSGSRGSGSGVWKTTDGGKKWSPITEAIDHLMVNALAIDPKYPSRVLLGTPHHHRDSCLLWESLNNGKSWKKLAPIRGHFEGKSILAFDAQKYGVMYLSMTDGIYVSNDDGKTWTRTLAGTVGDLVADPNRSGRVYAATKLNPGLKVYYSDSFGKATTWNTMTGCGNDTLPDFNRGAIDLGISGSKLFVSYFVDKTFYLYATTGKQCAGTQEPGWEQVFKKNVGTTLTELEADPDNPNNLYAYWSGPSSIWVSHDGGKNFNKVGRNAPHVDTHGFAFDPNNSNIVYALSDGGLFKSTDRGNDNTWSFIGEGILNAEIYHLAITPEDPNMIIAGTQDNGNISKKANSLYWEVIPGADGDGSDVEINPKKKTEFYTMHQYSSTLRKHSGGQVNQIGCTFNPCAYYTNFNFSLVPDEPDRLLAWYNDTLWTAKNPSCITKGLCSDTDTIWGSSKEWKALWKTPVNKGSIQGVAFDTMADLFYAATSSGSVYYSENKGKSWDTAYVPTFRAGIFDIAMDPVTTDVFYVSHNRNGNNRIVMIRRFYLGNKYSFSAADITSGFPSGLRAYTMAVDPKHKYLLYTGTSKGVYKGQSFDGGKSWIWTAFNNGLPKAAHVSDLEIYHKTGLLRAATKGRGIYSIRNYHDDLMVNVNPDTRTAAPGQTINYTVRLDNLGSTTATYKLTASQLDFFQYGLAPGMLTVAPGQSALATLSVQVPGCYVSNKVKHIFKVSANEVKHPFVYGEDLAELVVMVPDRQLTKDTYEPNDNFSGLNTIKVNASDSNPTKISKLTLHTSADVDVFRIELVNNAQAECLGKGAPRFGSFTSAFQPQYYPGSLSIWVKEEFCLPMDVAVYYEGTGSTKNPVFYKKYKTSRPISIPCPTQTFSSKVIFVKVWRKEKDKVNYELHLNLSDWMITLKDPLYEVGPLRYNLPPFIRDWNPIWRFGNYEEELAVFREQLQRIRDFETVFREGQLLKLQADIAIAADNRDRAASLLDQSQEIFGSIGAESAVGDIFRSRATLDFNIGRYEEALEELSQAMELHNATRNPEGLADDQWLMTDFQMRRGAFGEAMATLHPLYLQSRASGDFHGQLRALEALHELFMATYNVEGAMGEILTMNQLRQSAGIPEVEEILRNQEADMIHILGLNGYNHLKQLNAQQTEGLLETAMLREGH